MTIVMVWVAYIEYMSLYNSIYIYVDNISIYLMWWCDGPIFWVWKILKALTLVLYQAVIFTFQTNDSEQILLNFNSFTSIYIAIMLNINNLFFFDCYTQPAHPILVCFWTFPPDIVFFFKRQFLGREEVENSRCQGACHRPWTSFGSTSRRRGGPWLTTLTVVVWSYKRMSWGSWDHRVLKGLYISPTYITYGGYWGDMLPLIQTFYQHFPQNHPSSEVLTLRQGFG